MMEAFINKQDIHTSTAANVFGVSTDKVTADMRRKAKVVNFGIIYGISAFGLSQRLNVSRTEAKELIEAYFSTFSGIKTYMEEIVESAKENGFVETLLGRRRYLRDINSRNYTVRGFAERNAINAPIQGTAADMIKLAMINIHNKINDLNLTSKMTLQVHDELVFDTLPSEKEILKPLIIEENEKCTAIRSSYRS